MEEQSRSKVNYENALDFCNHPLLPTLEPSSSDGINYSKMSLVSQHFCGLAMINIYIDASPEFPFIQAY